MRFSLLTPPTDAPKSIPLSRGVPSVNAMAVDTGGLPRTLPLPALDPDAVVLPYQALARFAATGMKAGEDISTLILAAEAKKRELNNSAEIDTLYTSMVQKVDTDFEKMKVTESDQTLIPAFNTMWKTQMDAHLAQASNAEVQAGLTAKANGLLRVKSGEVTSSSTKKFVARQSAEFEQTVKTLQNLATNPFLTPEEQAIHQAELEKRFLAAAGSGLYPADQVAQKRTETLDAINLERAQTKASLNPMEVLEDFANGETYDLPSKHKRTIMDTANQTLRQQRQDREHADNLARQQRRDKQEVLTVGLRQQLIENWGPEGPKQSMVSILNQNARLVGDDNYKSLLETERTYQALATKPGPKKDSENDLRGELQAKLTATRFREVTQDELLGYMKAGRLDADDHRYFSARLDQFTEEAKKPKPETDDEKQRKLDVRAAEKTIETFIERSSKMIGTIEATSSGIIARDAITELNRMAKANPDMSPDDIAAQLIAKKMAQYQYLLDGLPYASRDEVIAAYPRFITKSEADRYIAIFDMVEKNKPPTKEPPKREPGLLEKIPGIGGLFAPKPEGDQPIRAPRKRKTP